MSTSTVCRAKDPSTCKVHGTPSSGNQLDPKDIFTPSKRILPPPAAEVHREAVRYLQNGDLTSTGERILNVFSDSGTTRGKRTVLLEDGLGNRRYVEWAAGTIITVHRKISLE